jgi:hypothetical protein
MDDTQAPATAESGAVGDSVAITLTGPDGETKQEASV